MWWHQMTAVQCYVNIITHTFCHRWEYSDEANVSFVSFSVQNSSKVTEKIIRQFQSCCCCFYPGENTSPAPSFSFVWFIMLMSLVGIGNKMSLMLHNGFNLNLLLSQDVQTQQWLIRKQPTGSFDPFETTTPQTVDAEQSRPWMSRWLCKLEIRRYLS